MKRFGTESYSFQIIATDISKKVLKKAQIAVYEEERTAAIPYEFKKRYLLRSKDSRNLSVRIVPELRKLVKFQRLNFMDSTFVFREALDIIFCRNVIIYFDKETQKKLLNKFYSALKKGGYIFMGHSEALLGMGVPFIQVVPTVYKKA